MSTNDKKINIYNKKFLPHDQLEEDFLDYLHKLIRDSHETYVSESGVYTYPVTGRSDTVDTIDMLTPGETDPGDSNGPTLKADNGHGYILELANSYRDDLPVENILASTYHVGLKFNWLPSETEINRRTGVIHWKTYEEEIGELAEPDAVAYYGGNLIIQVDSVCKSITQFGRNVRAYLKTPASEASGEAYEDAAVTTQVLTLANNGGANYFDVPNDLSVFFTALQTVTADSGTQPALQVSIVSVGADDSGGVGFTRIVTSVSLAAYLAADTFTLDSENNIITLAATLGQGIVPSEINTEYQVFLFGPTVTTVDLRLDAYYAYIYNYIGVGAGGSPAVFDYSDQKEIQTTTDTMKFVNSIITQNTSSAKFGWTAGNLNITDDNGAPADADVIGLIRIFGSSQVLNLTRQDGTGASTQIAIADGEILYVTLPASGNRTYTGSGAADTNYKIATLAAFVPDDFNYWLAFREGAKLFVRGLGELEIGEEVEIGDQIPQAVLSYIGAPDEATSTPAYSSAKVITQGSNLTAAIGTLDKEVQEYRFKTTIPSGGADKTVRIYPSKKFDGAGKDIYTFIDPAASSKFPRTGYSVGTYDGGANHDQLVTLTFSDPVVGVVTVTATGPTFGAQIIGTFTTVGGGANFTPITVLALTDDTLILVSGLNYASLALASADDALPVGASTQFKICTIINEVDAGNTTTQTILDANILNRRDFEHVTSAASVGTLFEAVADKTLLTGDNIAMVSFTTGATSRLNNLPAANANGDRIIRVRKDDLSVGCVAITPNGADTINGQSNFVLCHQGDYVSFMSDGVSDWVIIDDGIYQDRTNVNNFVLEPTTNTSGFTSDANTNPYGFFFDDGKPLYGKSREVYVGLKAIEEKDNLPTSIGDRQGFFPIDAKTGKPIKNRAFYGSWDIVPDTSTGGVYLRSSIAGDFVVINDIMDKLNILHEPNTVSGILSIWENGVDTTINLDPSSSNVLSGQNAANVIHNVNSTFGSKNIYYIELKKDDANPTYIYGIEIINERNASTQEITVTAHKRNIQGKEISVAAKIGANSFDVKEGIIGTKGGFEGKWIDKNGDWQYEVQEPTQEEQIGVAEYNAAASDSISGLSDTSEFYANSQGNLLRVFISADTDKSLLLVPTSAPDANNLTLANDYEGTPDTTLFASNLQFEPDGTTSVVIADQAAITVELYAKIGENADHSNEEPLQRRIGWDSKLKKQVSRDRSLHLRDFGNQRSDDFTSLSTVSDAAFTMDDGKTNFVAEDCVVINGALVPNLTDDFHRTTIYCSGLDIEVDVVNGTKNIRKLFSDAPVQDHTIMIKYDGVNAEIWVDGIFCFEEAVAGSDLNRLFSFIPYLPKQPALTENFHYDIPNYIVADEVLTSLPTKNLAAYNGAIDQGMIRKQSEREFVYIGTWTYGVVSTSKVGGRRVYGSTGVDGAFNIDVFGSGNFRSWIRHGSVADTVDILVDGVKVQDYTPADGNINGIVNAMGTEGLHNLEIQRDVFANSILENQAVDFHCIVWNPEQWRFNPHRNYLIDGQGVCDNRKFSAYDDKPIQRRIIVYTNVSDGQNLTTTPGIILCALGVEQGEWIIEGKCMVVHDGVDNLSAMRGVIKQDDVTKDTYYTHVEFQGNSQEANPKGSISVQKISGINFSLFASITSIYETQFNEGIAKLMLTKISEDD